MKLIQVLLIEGFLIENLKEYYENYYKWSHSYLKEDNFLILPKEKGNEKIIRVVLVDNNKNFPTKNKDKVIKGKLGIVSYREIWNDSKRVER